jgi:hypothetical protein
MDFGSWNLIMALGISLSLSLSLILTLGYYKNPTKRGDLLVIC